MVEMLWSMKYWELANAKQHHYIEDKDLEDTFDDLCLDDEAEWAYNNDL
jgi:hypothetical protein